MREEQRHADRLVQLDDVGHRRSTVDQELGALEGQPARVAGGTAQPDGTHGLARRRMAPRPAVRQEHRIGFAVGAGEAHRQAMPPGLRGRAARVVRSRLGLLAVPPVVGTFLRARGDEAEPVEIGLVGERPGVAERQVRLLQGDEPVEGHVDHRRELPALVGVAVPFTRRRLPVLVEPDALLDRWKVGHGDVQHRPDLRDADHEARHDGGRCGELRPAPQRAARVRGRNGAGRFLSSGQIDEVAQPRGRGIDRAPDLVDLSDRPMLRQGMPRRVGKVLAEALLVGPVEVLRRNGDGGNALDRGVPLDGGIVDHLRRGIGPELHEEVERRRPSRGREVVDHRAAQVVLVAVLRRDGSRHVLRIGHDAVTADRRVAAAEGIRHLAPERPRQRAVGGAVVVVLDDVNVFRVGLFERRQPLLRLASQVANQLLEQSDIPVRIAHEEDRTIDQDEVVSHGGRLGLEDLLARHADQLDGHALRARFTVFGLRTVGKADDRVIAPGLGEQADLVARGNVVEHLERRPDDAMGLGMLPALGDASLHHRDELQQPDLPDLGQPVFRGRFRFSGHLFSPARRFLFRARRPGTLDEALGSTFAPSRECPIRRR